MDIINLGKKYTYEKYMYDCDKMVDYYKRILKKIDYGNSHDNRKLIGLLLGKGECRIICSSGVHGRENINTVVLMKIIETYCQLYESNSDYFTKIHNILDKISILFLPMVNPDGYEIVDKGFGAIRNKRLNFMLKFKNIDNCEWKYNARGVDINRNFYSKTWKKKFQEDIYFSERETLFLKKLFDEYKADIYIDFHSRGESIYYYRQIMDDNYNNKQFILANIISKLTGYIINEPEMEIENNDSGGSTVHYYSEIIGGNALTVETVSEYADFPLDITYQQTVFNQISKIPIVLAKYLTRS